MGHLLEQLIFPGPIFLFELLKLLPHGDEGWIVLCNGEGFLESFAGFAKVAELHVRLELPHEGLWILGCLLENFFCVRKAFLPVAELGLDNADVAVQPVLDVVEFRAPLLVDDVETFEVLLKSFLKLAAPEVAGCCLGELVGSGDRLLVGLVGLDDAEELDLENEGGTTWNLWWAARLAVAVFGVDGELGKFANLHGGNTEAPALDDALSNCE